MDREEAVQPPEDEVVDGVAALAVGLAFASDRVDDDAIDELVDAAHGDVAVLEHAQARVSRITIGDPNTQRRASQLLIGAVHRVSTWQVD